MADDLERLALIEDWLKKIFPEERFVLHPASSDASFRRYYRATFKDSTLIVMDAPPPHEDCRPFVKIAGIFREAGVHLPEIISQDIERGFLLLSDLGNRTYLEALDDGNADELYREAAESLIRIQLQSRPGVLPDYSDELLMREMNLFRQWYLEKNLGLELGTEQIAILEKVLARLLENNLSQPRVYVHRDYHSRNLMVTEPNPGILDFQDAVYGPITYDIVSLFRDAYISWEEERVLDWVIRYWEKARKSGLPVNPDFSEFYRDFEWMGAQRQLKVVGIFSRLHHRDGKSTYLEDIPLVLSYLKKTCARYAELSPLLRLFEKFEVRTTF